LKRVAQTLASALRPLLRFALRSLLAASLLVTCPPLLARAQATTTLPREYELKSVYLYNFLQFVNFPADKCPPGNERVEEIGILGDSPITANLLALQAELKRTRGVELKLRFFGPYREGMDLSGCRLLFIAQSEMRQIRRILADLKGGTALTVADNEDCLDQGCMVALLSQASKIRWAINRRSVDASGLRINARLLEMAVKVVE